MTDFFIFGTGPSFDKKIADKFRGLGTSIAINDSFEDVPWADSLYACDYPWWKHKHGAKSFLGAKYSWSPDACREFPDINRVEFEQTGGNSGFQAIELAIMQGAKRIYILGLDMCRSESGESHYFGEHPSPLNRGSNYTQWIKNFRERVSYYESKGVQIFNLSKISKLDFFPYITAEEAILCAQVHQSTYFKDRFCHLEHLMHLAKVHGTALEFGVYKGDTLRIIDKFWRGKVFGFDSFEGLPEAWDVGSPDRPHPKGKFACSVPEGFSKRTKLIKGWFEDTLENWKFDEEGDVSFLHIDSDLYSSAKYVLSQLDSRIVSGTVICFDELINFDDGWYKNWCDGEWKALVEWLRDYCRVVKPISRSKNQAAFLVIE